MTMFYNPDPALYSDLLFSILLHFNINDPQHLEPFINPKKRAADMKYYSDCLAKFDEPHEELCPFFAVSHTQTFAFSKMYDRLCQHQEYSVKQLREYLPDSQTMLYELLSFFLPAEVGEGVPPIAKLSELIAGLPLAPLVKYHLLSMYIEPEKYYTLLFATLEKRLQQMKAYYKDNQATINAVKKVINEEEIKTFLQDRYAMTGAVDAETTFCVTLISKNTVRFVPDDEPLLLLGYDYSARMATLRGEAIKPDIVKMGKALSEEKRVMILELLLIEKEITAQQLLKKLDLSMTATHYHLEMMLQAGMLSTRNEGRTIFYSLNHDYFDRAPLVFERFNSESK